MLELYDPDRSRSVVHDGKPSTWDEFLAFLDGHAERLGATAGEGLAILCEDAASPVIRLLREKLAAALPEVRWYVDAGRATDLRPPRLKLDQADVILSLDCDLLNIEDAGVVHRKAFAQRRSMDAQDHLMNRLYVVEPCPTVTGLAADHRLRLPLSRMHSYVLTLAKALGVEGLPAAGQPEWDPRWIDLVADELTSHAGRGCVVAGLRLPAGVHHVVDRINQTLGGSDPKVRQRC